MKFSNYKNLLILIIFLIGPLFSFGQNQESSAPKATKEKKLREYDPNKAALWSAVLPGAGQIYNGRAWKAPIVWGGLATFTALAIWNNNAANEYTELAKRAEAEPDNPELRSVTAYERGRDQAIRYRDLNIILGVLWYGLNIMDAYVDAHLKEFEVNDNLSLQLKPKLYTDGTQFQPGVALGIKIRP